MDSTGPVLEAVLGTVLGQYWGSTRGSTGTVLGTVLGQGAELGAVLDLLLNVCLNMAPGPSYLLGLPSSVVRALGVEIYKSMSGWGLGSIPSEIPE